MLIDTGVEIYKIYIYTSRSFLCPTSATCSATCLVVLPFALKKVRVLECFSVEAMIYLMAMETETDGDVDGDVVLECPVV